MPLVRQSDRIQVGCIVFSLADELLTSESTYYGQTSACGCETVDRVPVAQLRVTDANQTLNGKIFPGYSVTVDGHVRDRVRQGRSVNRNEEGQREAEQKQGQKSRNKRRRDLLSLSEKTIAGEGGREGGREREREREREAMPTSTVTESRVI